MLEALAFLSILDEPDLEWLVTNSKRQEIASGSVLIRQGEPVEFLYLIVDGAFNVTVWVHKEIRVARLYAGELLGEMSFVDSQPPAATVSAGMNSSVLAVTKADLIRKIRDDAGFAARFYKGISVILSDRLRAALKRGSRDELDLRVDPKEDRQDEDELHALATRFEEIHRRLRGRAKGA